MSSTERREDLKMAIEEVRTSLAERLRLALQLALAALLASASGGLLLVLLLAIAVFATALPDADSARSVASAAPPIAIMLLMLSGLAIVPAIAACWLPAFLAGAILRTAGRRHGWARRRSAWAAAGAAVAGIAFFRAFPSGSAELGRVGLPAPALAAAVLLAGAGAAQVFRSAMAAIAPFFGFDEEEA
jgi:hypothetical protein